MFKKLVSVLIVSLITTFTVFASADPLTMTCKATGTELTLAQCAAETQKQLDACKATTPADCAKTAPKPVPDIQCLENPDNAGKIKRTGKWSCTCEDPNFHVALANYGAQRCYLTIDGLLVDELTRLRELLKEGRISPSEFASMKKKLDALAPENFVSKTEFNDRLKGIDSRFEKIEKRVGELEAHDKDHEERITKLEKSSPATHPPFSVIPEVGGMLVFRPASGRVGGASLGLRLRYNAASSNWFFQVGGTGMYGSSQGNGASYLYQGQLAVGAYLSDSRTVSIELGPYAQAHAADMQSNLPGGITTNDRGHAIGGYLGLDWRFAGNFNLRAEAGLGSGIDNAVNPDPAYPGGPHASRRETGLQPFGGLKLGYAFDF